MLNDSIILWYLKSQPLLCCDAAGSAVLWSPSGAVDHLTDIPKAG